MSEQVRSGSAQKSACLSKLDSELIKVRSDMEKKDCYIEIEGLFVECELDEWRCDVTNVQLPHPDDPKDVNRWLDLTDHLTQAQLDYLGEQIIDALPDPDDGRGDWEYDNRKDERAVMLSVDNLVIKQ